MAPLDSGAGPLLDSASAQMDVALRLVKKERMRQDLEFGFFRDHVDDVGPTSRYHARDADELIVARGLKRSRPSWRNILLEEVQEAFCATHPDELAMELEQVAAVATAWREALHRREQKAVPFTKDTRPMSWWARVSLILKGRLP